MYGRDRRLSMPATGLFAMECVPVCLLNERVQKVMKSINPSVGEGDSRVGIVGGKQSGARDLQDSISEGSQD